MIQNDLYIENQAQRFYEKRFSTGYMEDWSNEKKQRVIDVIENLNLPESGECLDFGCGNGVFTDVLHRALPKWDIYGCDISKVAIQNAHVRFPECTFFVNDDSRYFNKKFDFIFSHHVLEHVFNIKQIAVQIDDRAKKNSKMLHIFPCGNEGSFEHYLCSLREDGINPKMENRFFFEDEGHVRRMTTEDCIDLFKPYKFVLKKDYYSNQYYGAMDWIISYDTKFIMNLFNPKKGKDVISKIILFGMLLKFLMLSLLRRLATIYEKISSNELKKRKHLIFLFLFKLPAKVSKYFDEYIKSLSMREWDNKRFQRKGSEMYLFFTKN